MDLYYSIHLLRWPQQVSSLDFRVEHWDASHPTQLVMESPSHFRESVPVNSSRCNEAVRKPNSSMIRLRHSDILAGPIS